MVEFMTVLDRLSERFFNEYGEQWLHILDINECNKKISEFFKRCHQPILAYLSKESFYFNEFENALKEKKNSRILYHDKPLTFIVGEDNVLIEQDDNQLFIKYHSKILGKKLSEEFYNLENKVIN